MTDLISNIVLSVVMFAATNADDLVLLTIFFSQAECKPRQVVIGQLAGIGALTAISYTASMLALAVPHAWLPLVGIVPFWLGVRWLRRSETSETPSVAMTWWAIAGITMANGGDNLGVYIPSFVIQTGTEKVITGAVFTLLTFCWCGIAWTAVRHPTWGPVVSRICRRLAPFILMGIGLWIIAHHPFFGLFSPRDGTK